jgi:aspartyl-tRNA(Asn)/glutamyl-tRNA(Gln) amidotransferase subunit B
MATRYETVIGLEVHAQLLTESKIFCGCSTKFGQVPNQNTCPVCTGFPGVLPVLNKKVVEFAIRAGLATHCEITPTSRLARKNYFYPDLPKGYQISQYEQPICATGYIDIEVNGKSKRIRLTRIHIEEDAGKSIHDVRGDASLVDLNRAGVPLLEIVSEPDIRSAEEAGTFLRILRVILEYLGICNGNMEEGSFRCDANVSVRPEGTEILGTKTELKNLNSFKAVEKALEYEVRRHIDTLAEGEKLIQETRLWDPDREVTRSMRNKESAHDYRYFPDPDLLPIIVKDDWVGEIRRSIPELSEARKARFIEQHKLPVYDAELLTSRRDIADYFESALKSHRNSKALSNWIVGDLFRVLKDRRLDEQLYITLWPIPPEALAELVRLIDEGKISGRTAKTIFAEVLDSGRFPNEVVAAKGLEQLSDSASIERAIAQVLTDHPKQVAEYRRGTRRYLAFWSVKL